MLRRFQPYRHCLLSYFLALIFSVTGIQPVAAHKEEQIKMVVVGDTGIGERAYRPGFDAVVSAMRKEGAMVLLHLGDFVYQDRLFPDTCPHRYINTIKQTLTAPFPVRVFVAGDNDLPPVKWKPKASGCWDQIAPMATPFDAFKGEPGPGPREGVMNLELALMVVLDAYDWKDPAPWLAPLIERARAKHQWVIVALHEPALTTAWYVEKRQTVLKQINALSPDLVFAGNQHSYERFYPLGVPDDYGNLPFVEKSDYLQGEGVTHIVAGGGGATFKPFADLSGRDKNAAPPEVKQALAKRALMFHYLTVEMDDHRLTVRTFRVCTPESAEGNPRWRPKMKAWKTIPLECDGQPPGVTLYDTVTIRNP
ncbi:hypothetical protein LQ236_000880 [Nitrospina gracilis]|uniref:metallophosphoesterase n=1 Tax=Nitrospina sp. Nb-3 TaxID=2940485 RepID=UPI001F3EC1D3|nr:metallophosphoesterase [Nitrospina sp. Nb-3]MCF8722860.1 hypothetical protein [Nitrospina sp. Nb-3]